MQESIKNKQLTEQNVRQKYGKLPLHFIENKGQIDPYIRYYAQGKGFRYAFTSDSALLTFYELLPSKDQDFQSIIRSGNPHFMKEQAMEHKVIGVTLAMHFLNANPEATLEGRRIQSGKLNFFRDNDPEKWFTNVPIYSEVVYRNIWEGIDLVFYEKDRRLKYDFILQPGANVEDIQLSYKGCESVDLDEEGNLCLLTPFGVFRDEKPISYQEIDGEYRIVESQFVVKQAPEVTSFGFEVTGSYDPHNPLVIDPGLIYSTYLGGSGFDNGNGIAIDNFGNVYVTGRTDSINFPITPGAFDTSFNGIIDAFVTKLDASGRTLVYSTYLGGSDNDQGRGIAIDPFGNAYVTGRTTSTNFPTTPGVFDTSFNGIVEAFVTKLDSTGSTLVYSTYLGGSGEDEGFGIAIDDYGNAYVTGLTTSTNFPATPGVIDTSHNGSFDAFVTKLDAMGSALVYSTYLGGSAFDQGFGIAIDAFGNAYVTGFTDSSNYPTTPGAFDTTFNGINDVFVTKLDATGNALVYSTYLGGSSDDRGFAIATDNFGNTYVTGRTSPGNFPITPGAFDSTISGDDVFVTKLDVTGSALVYSTYLGGSSQDRGNGLVVDLYGNAYVIGETQSINFPVTPGAFDPSFNGGNIDAFVTKLDSTGSTLVYSTYLGGSGDDRGSGIAIDDYGNAYVTGLTTSTNFPTTPGAFDTSFNGVIDAFVTKIQT